MFRKSAIVVVVALGAVGFFFTGCKKIKELVTVEIPVTMEVNFTIPIIEAPGLTGFGTYEVPVNVNEIIKSSNSDMSVNNIKSARIVSCVVTATPVPNYPDDNFTVLSAINADFSSNTKTEWVQIAALAGIPANGYSLDLPTNGDTELKDYLTGSLFRYKVSGTSIRTTSAPIPAYSNKALGNNTLFDASSDNSLAPRVK